MKEPTLAAMAVLSTETMSQLYERHLTVESATADNISKPSGGIKTETDGARLRPGCA